MDNDTFSVTQLFPWQSPLASTPIISSSDVQAIISSSWERSGLNLDSDLEFMQPDDNSDTDRDSDRILGTNQSQSGTSLLEQDLNSLVSNNSFPTLDTATEATNNQQEENPSTGANDDTESELEVYETPLLDARSHPKFINPLPQPTRIDATAGGSFTVDMRETEQWLGLYEGPGEDGEYGTEDDERLNTTVWGYGLRGQTATYPGPTFVTQSYVPIEVRWENQLPRGEHLLPLEAVEHVTITESIGEALEQGYIPAVTHLHGGHTEAASDGGPGAWYTQDYALTGENWVKEDYFYANDQEAGTLWYHDHGHGISSHSVYAGLTGFYLLRDNNENSLIDNGVLPSGAYEREIVLQDRAFTAEGELFYPVDPLPGVTARNGSYGNFILANGMAWPTLEVEPRKYRLRLLNASDSRFFELQFNDPSEKIYQIGTDLSLLEQPVALDSLTIAPAERYDVIVDFTDDAGKEFLLRNVSSGAEAGTVGEIMKIEVNQPLSDVPNATVDTDESDGLTTQLRPDPIVPPDEVDATRQLIIAEVEDVEPAGEPPSRNLRDDTVMLLGTLEDGTFAYDDPVTETPVLGDTEVWEFYNSTQYRHPIHVHLVPFQILDRQQFGGSLYTEADRETGEMKTFLDDVNLIGEPQPPSPSESGLKDTVIVNPGEVVRIIATFDKPGEYVWHCHILTHAEHDMIRPFEVVLAPEPVTDATESDPLLSGEAELPADTTDAGAAEIPDLVASETSLGQQSSESIGVNDDPLNLSPTTDSVSTELETADLVNY